MHSAPQLPTAAPPELIDALNAIVRTAREGLPLHPRVAMFIADRERLQLRHGVSDGVSLEWVLAADGFEINPNNPSCGSAAATGERVLVYDVTTDEKWAPFIALANEHGIRACWSIPLKAEGITYGTLAAYHAVPLLPTTKELEMLEHLALYAATLLSRSS